MNKKINKIFNDKKLHDLDPNLTLLPFELKRDIYTKYFYPNRLVIDLLEELESNECKTLNIINLFPILQKVLKDDLAIEYLLDNYVYICPYYKSNIFKKLFEDIIIDNKKYFKLIIDPVEDFALSWLHIMYK